jgi:hypothetical protein
MYHWERRTKGDLTSDEQKHQALPQKYFFYLLKKKKVKGNFLIDLFI